MLRNCMYHHKNEVKVGKAAKATVVAALVISEKATVAHLQTQVFASVMHCLIDLQMKMESPLLPQLPHNRMS